MTETYRRNPIRNDSQQFLKETSTSSVSTEGSSSPRYYQARSRGSNKEKLELCKTYSEFGYCPYEKKCKFAHGYHELRKNNTANSKYKTKECVTFIKNCFCHYGSRCNFIHTNEECEDHEFSRAILPGYVEILQSAKSSSKVLAMLEN